MSNEHSLISQMRAITVSREYGSGGGEIASRLASHLGWELVDHEIVATYADSHQSNALSPGVEQSR